MELPARMVQLCQARWRERLLGAVEGGSIEDERHLFMGTDEVRGNICICPALNEWIGDQLHKEALASKEARKAREERALARGANK